MSNFSLRGSRMLHSFKKWISAQKVIALENSSSSVRHSVLSRIWINPHAQKEIPLQSLLALQRKERHLLLLLGAKSLRVFCWPDWEKTESGITWYLWGSKTKKMTWLILFLFPFIFHFLYFIFICLDVWTQVIKHLTDNHIIPWCVALQQVSLYNYWFNRVLGEDTIRADVTF